MKRKESLSKWKNSKQLEGDAISAGKACDVTRRVDHSNGAGLRLNGKP